MKLLPVLASGLWLLASGSSHALIDTDGDGLGDAWEGLHSFAIGANPPANQAPASDPDSDGWTNLQESTAGTNPFSAASPGGILVPAVAYTPAIREPAPPGAEIGQTAVAPPSGDPNDPSAGGGGAGGTYTNPLEIRRPARFTLTWQPVSGKAYCVYHSADLVTWQPASGFFMGGNDPLSYQGEAINADNTEPDKIFYRVKVEDADNDGDTLTDYEESLLGTDAYSTDTDRDGLPDNLDPQPLVNVLTSDPDGPGLPASLATGLLAKWDLESTYIAASQGSFYTLARYADSAGGFPIIPFHTETKADGMPSKGAGTTSAAFGFLCPPRTLLHNRTTYSVSMWAKIEKGSISSSRPTAALFTHHRRLPKAAPYQAQYKIDINGMWIERLANGEQVIKAGTSNFINYVPGTNQQTNGTWTFSGVTSSAKPAGTLDDGKWHHFLAVHTSGTVTLYMDGQPIGANGNVIIADINATNETKAGISLGRYYGEPAEDGFPYTDPLAAKASFDRVKVWSRTLTAAEALTLYHQDIDNDGLWDITESRTRLWRDANSDAIAQDGEHSFASSPYLWQPITNDTDGDDLTDTGEQAAGTGISTTDSDGDRLPDGYEAANNLNPLDATGQNGANGDPDGDGVTNLDEYRHHTKPTQLAGDPAIPQPGSSWDSDGDGTRDGPEIAAGSHPGDPSDGGQPLAPEEKISVKLGIGDKSGSHSEDYSLVVAGIDPETGIEKDIYTLHSQGYGQYRTETKGFFRKGRNYTFRIVWNGTNNSSQSNSSGTEGPDFDYTFEVQPQGADTGFLIDGYDPQRGLADPGQPLLAADASDVADTEVEFKTNYQNRRVVLMGVSTVSADRMFGASMQVLPGLEDIQLQITNNVTGEDFGTHSQLFVKAYDNYEGILGYGDNFGKDISDPRVWFIKDEQTVIRRIQAYLCTDPVKDPGEITIGATFRGVAIGQIKHTLSGDPSFGKLLEISRSIAAGTGLGFADATGGSSPNGTPAPGASHHWTAAMNIPIFILHQADENTTLMATGIYNGFIAGLADDAEFVQLIVGGGVKADLWLKARAISYLSGWASDPKLRMRQLKEAITGFVKEYVCKPAAAISYKLSTPDDWINTFWDAQLKAQAAVDVMKALAIQGLWTVVVDGTADWWNDFCRRMTDETEALVGNAAPFPKSPLLTGTIVFQQTAAYTLGYCTGYLTEQVVVGYLSAGGITIGKVLLTGGERIAASLATRTTAMVASKSAWLRAYIGESPALANAVEREMHRMGIILYASDPTTPVIKDTAAHILESLMRREGFDRSVFNQKLLQDALLVGNLRKLTAIAGKEAFIHKRAAQLATLLGDEADAAIMKNFLKVVEERLVVVHPDGAVDEYFEGFFRAFEANPGLLNDLDSGFHSIVGYSPEAKARLKQFLSDPNPGDLWKIDDPIWGPTGEPDIPQNYWTRGIVAELDVYYRQYRKASYTHYPQAGGYDFVGARHVQIKSVKNPPGAIESMKAAIQKLVASAPSSQTPLRLHILKKPGTDSTELKTALDTYKNADPNIKDRLDIVIEAYNVGVQ